MLSLPLTSKVLTRSGSGHFTVGTATMQGWEKEMSNDYMSSLRMAKHPNWSCFGVFDGSEGDVCARWVAANIESSVDSLSSTNDNEMRCMSQKLREDFERRFGRCRAASSSALVLAECSSIEDCSLTICIAGGCQVVICRETGSVDYGGTKAFQQLKSSYMKKNVHERAEKAPWLTLAREEFGPQDFLLITSDDLFSACSQPQIVKFVRDKMNSSIGNDPAMIAAVLLDEMLKQGFQKNMTATIVLLQDGTSYHRDDDEFLPGPYLPLSTTKEAENSDFVLAYQQYAAHHGFSLEKSIVLENKNRSKGYYPPPNSPVSDHVEPTTTV